MFEGVCRDLRVLESVWETWNLSWCHANYQAIFIDYLLMTSIVIGAFGIV